MATIQELENRLNALEKAFLQAQKNQVPVTAKVDDTANRVVQITPYTESKTVYIDDEYVIFDNVPDGNLLIFTVDSDDQNVPCTYERMGTQVRVSFEQRESLATVTIVVQ